MVDVHLSDQFSGFGGALPDKEGTIVYVSNETVKQRLQNEFKKAKIVVGEANAVKQVKVTYSSEDLAR